MNKPSSTYCPSTSNATYSGTFVGFASAGKEKDLETGLSYFVAIGVMAWGIFDVFWGDDLFDF